MMGRSRIAAYRAACLTLVGALFVTVGLLASPAHAASPSAPSWTADPAARTAQIWRSDPAKSPPVAGALAHFERVAAPGGAGSGEILRIYFVYPDGYKDPDICLSGAPFTSYVAAGGRCSPILVICPSLPQPHFTFAGTPTTGEYSIPIGTTWAGRTMYFQLRLTVPGGFAFPGAVSGTPFYGNVAVPPSSSAGPGPTPADSCASTTPSTTTPTTAPPTTTASRTTAAPSTTVPVAVEAVVAVAPPAAHPAAVAQQVAPQELARTGPHTAIWIMLGLTMILMGLAVSALTRLPTTSGAATGSLTLPRPAPPLVNRSGPAG